MTFGYKELTDEEKSAFWDVLVSAIADIPDLAEEFVGLGGKANALLGVGIAAIQLFKSKLEYKKYYQNFESIGRGLIPREISTDDTKQIFQTVIDYLKHSRKNEKKLSYYYLNKTESSELVDDLFNACHNSDKDWAVSDELLRKALENLTFVLLQNNNDDVMLLTETADVIRDILERLEQDGKDIELLINDVAALKATLLNLKPRYSSLINCVELPDNFPCSNIFSFRNHAITFCGRDEEIAKIKEWLTFPGVSVYGITGPGGSGKSRLALHIAHLEEDNRKVVWADKTLLAELMTCNDFSYSQPVLFIFDYAAQFEKDLDKLIKLVVSRKNPNVKFLLLERSDKWYVGFRKQNDVLKSISVESPIELSSADPPLEKFPQMMQDLSDAKYDKRTIPEEVQKQIIQKTIQLSDGKSARILFLLLLTDAYLKTGSIDYLSSEDLFSNYIDRSYKMINESYDTKIITRGFRVLAYATACDGIKWEEEHPTIQEDLNHILNYLTEDRDEINRFFKQISESSEDDVVSPLKPDLIGEFCFLHEWKKLIKSARRNWLSPLLKLEYSRFFFARCLADWAQTKEVIPLYEMLSDQNADAEQRALCAEVLNYAIREAHSKEIQMEYLVKIKELDYNTSIFILNVFTDAIRFIFENAEKAIRNRCIDEINKIDFQMYSYKDDSDRILISAAMENIASLYISYDLIEKALNYYESAKNVLEGLVDSEKYSLQLAELYNNIARSYIYLRDMKPQFVTLSLISLQYYFKALEILNKPAYYANPLTVTILNGLASVYIDAKLFDEAIECFEQCLLIIQVGNVPPTIAAKTFFKMGALFYDLMMFEDAIKYYKKALDIQNRELGELHADTMMTYNNIALAYHQMGDKNPIYYKDALEYYLHDMHNKEKVYGENNTETAITYLNMAHLYNSMGDTEKAIHYALLAEPTHVNYYGPDNHWTQEIYGLLAKLYTKAGQIENAQKYMNKLKKNN